MYYTGLDPRTMKPVYVATDPHEKAMQRALIQYRNPKNYHLVREALIKAGREDLIGFGRECLIRPPGGHRVDGPRPVPKGGKPEQKGRKATPAPKGGKPAERPAKGGKPAPAKEAPKPGYTGGKRPAGWAKPKAKPNARRGKR